MFPFWILPELTMMQVVVTTGAIRRGQSNHRQQTNINLFNRLHTIPDA